MGGERGPEVKPIELKDRHGDQKQIEKDLKDYYERFEGKKKPPEAELKQFETKLNDWNQKGDVEAIRTGGITEKEDLDDYLKRHTLLSEAFLKPSPTNSARLKVDFKGNDLAEWKVGAGDLLPPNVASIIVYKSGSKINAVRARNPRTGRIGYYEEEALKRDDYDYVAIHSGDEIEITGTINIPAMGSRQSLAENFAVYKQGAMRDSASEGDEYRYDAQKKVLYPDVQTALNQRRGTVKGETGKSLDDLSHGVFSGRGGSIEIDGKNYEKTDQDFWAQYCGTNEIEAKKWVTREDPVKGGALTFLGAPIPDGMNVLIIPYLKEAERRIKAEGVEYHVHTATCTCWRKIRGKESMSYHSWGVALDVNPGDNPMGSKWDDLDASKRIPPRIIEIMESMGFRWGGRWTARPDAMHFEYRINPITSQSLLTSDESKQYMAAAEKKAGTDSVQRMQMATKAPAVGPQMGSEVAPGQPQQSVTRNLLTIASDHDRNFAGMQVLPEKKQLIDRFVKIYEQNKARYEQVGRATDMPPALIAALHNRESGMRFNTYLHNGQPLGKPTTMVPRGVFFREDQWEEAAVDALRSAKSVKDQLGIHYDTTDMGKLMAFAEAYNGMGYRKKARPSPYVYSGTNMYQGGLYVADGRYDANAKDKGVGVAAMLVGAHQAEGGGEIPHKPNEAVA